MLALIGFVGIFVHQMIQAHALTLTSAVQTGWLIGLTPIWSAVLATVFLGEGFGRRKVVGLIIGAVGTLVLITRGALSLGVLALPAMLIPFFVGAAGWQEYRGLSSSTVTAILFLGVGCSGLGYLLWYAALERIEASQVAAFLYLEPLVTLVAAVAFLGEPVALSTILGGVLVLAGVLIVQTVE